MQINLLPWREKARTIKKRRLAAGTILSAAIAILLLASYHIYLSSINNDQSHINDYLQSEVKNESAAITANNTQEKDKGIIETKLKFIISLFNRNNTSINFLNEMATIVPQNISLSQISSHDTQIVVGGYAASDAEVTEFLDVMKKSPVFTNVELNQITSSLDKNEGRRNFEIVAEQKE